MHLIIAAIFVIILFLGWFYYTSENKNSTPIVEKFGDAVAVQQTHEIIDLSKQFTDMITFDNDAEGRLGIDYCIEKCNGYCVEKGQTGAADCFPARPAEKQDFEGDIVSNEKQLSYPNIR